WSALNFCLPDMNPPTPNPGVTRRGFIELACGWAAGTFAGLAAGIGAVRFLSSTCTHLGCTVNHTGEGFHCPCHGSTFDSEGKVTSGPAPRALTWYLVTLSKDERLLVDKGQIVESDKYLVV